ncbi:MAG: LamG domain-containing protein [Candidatus Poribacteria bacterium]|nr:LamG domain-containing protein [Candidatus Poribacteria bacterium]
MKWLAFLFIVVLLFTTSQATAKLEKDLVVYFTFDNVKGNKVLDASGNDLDAEIIANVDFVEGKYGDAIHIAAELEGDDCLNIPVDDLLKIEGKMTMMAWVFNEDWVKNSGKWFDKGSHVLGEEKKGYSMGLINDVGAFKGPNIGMRLGGIQAVYGFNTTGPMVDKNWHHIAGTYDGKTAKIYLDGEILSNVDSTFEFSGTNDIDLRIGCTKNRPQYTFKNGFIDEVGVWQRALSQAEIAEAMKGFLAVSPKDKVATTWGDIKHRAITDE